MNRTLAIGYIGFLSGFFAALLFALALQEHMEPDLIPYGCDELEFVEIIL